MNSNKTTKKLWIFIPIAVVLCILALLLGNQKQKTISDTRFMLDTVVTVTLYDSNSSSILDGVFDLCQSYEDLLSRTKESSEIYQFNNRKTNEPFTVSDDTAELLEKGLYYSKLSNGAFDITIAPASSLWDFKAETPALPDENQLKNAVKDIDYRNLHLDGNVLTSDDPRTQIDLGAIAKGFIADKMKEYLLEQGVQSAIINLGGNVLCVGEKPVSILEQTKQKLGLSKEDKSAFLIGLQKPFESHQEVVGTLNIHDLSVVSSGIYERYFRVDGTLYHHILNPKTGYPYNNHLLAVTILSDKSVDGDALSTVTFSLGLEEGTKLIESLPNTYAAFITEDGTLHYTKGFEQFLKK